MEIWRLINTDTRVSFPIMKTDGTFITGAAGLDSEFAILGAHGAATPSFADCTHEAVEIGTTGIYILDVSAAEINGVTSVIQIKSSTSGAITQVILINTNPQDANITQLLGTAMHTPATAGIPYVDVHNWNGTAVSAPATAGIPEVNLKNIANAAVSATTAQLGVNVVNWNNTVVHTPALAGVPYVDVHNWEGTAVHTPTLAGVPYVDVHNWNGTAVSAPATAGIVEVNVKNINNVATTSVTTISANQGTTQPVNFTGTGATAYVKVDEISVAGTAQTANDNGADINTIVTQATNAATDALAAHTAIDAAAGGLLDIHTDVGTAITAIGDVHATDLPAIATELGLIHTHASNADTQATAAASDALAAHTAADLIHTDVDAVLADTGELQTDWANGGRLDLLLDGASAAGDPWLTLIPGLYTAGMAGYILGTNVDAKVSEAGGGIATLKM